MRLHHIQLAMPAGLEDTARHFYAELLGLEEVERPARSHDGQLGFCCFDDQGLITTEIHLEVGAPVPEGSGHTGLRLADREELTLLAHTLEQAEVQVDWSGRHSFEGYERFFVQDPFGNHLELLAPAYL